VGPILAKRAYRATSRSTLHKKTKIGILKRKSRGEAMSITREKSVEKVGDEAPAKQREWVTPNYQLLDLRLAQTTQQTSNNDGLDASGAT
jgi:hypothetical protein